MSKTAKLSHLDRARWILLVLAVCLLLHFLVEDSALLRVGETGQQAGKPVQTEAAGSDEMTHQDDLALPAHLLERMVCPTPVIARLERLAPAQPVLHPHHLPPKIA